MRIWEVTCERCTEGKTLCVDFDGTIASDAYPNIGDPMPGAKEVLTKLRSEGYYIILWTCRAGKTLAEARKWLKEKGIVVDAVNTNNPKDKFQGNPKVSADIYIDDRIVGGFPGWYRVYELITGKAFGMSESLMEAATKKTPGQIVADLLVKHKTPAKALDAITNAINVGTKRMSPESLLVHKEAKALLMKYSAGGAEMQKILQARIKGVGKPKAKVVEPKAKEEEPEDAESEDDDFEMETAGKNDEMLTIPPSEMTDTQAGWISPEGKVWIDDAGPVAVEHWEMLEHLAKSNKMDKELKDAILATFNAKDSKEKYAQGGTIVLTLAAQAGWTRWYGGMSKRKLGMKAENHLTFEANEDSLPAIQKIAAKLSGINTIHVETTGPKESRQTFAGSPHAFAIDGFDAKSTLNPSLIGVTDPSVLKRFATITGTELSMAQWKAVGDAPESIKAKHGRRIWEMCLTPILAK